MSDTTKSVDDKLRAQIDMEFARFNMLGNVQLIENITQLFAKQLKEAEIRARIEGAIMGAKFGNAAFRQYNIANPGKPINLDTTRKMGIEQATEWAKRHVE